MKYIYTYSIALLAFFVMAANVQAQQPQKVESDYQIQKDFKKELKSINEALDEVGSVAGSGQVVDRIKSLESNYSEYSTLLDKALYPDTFDQRLEELKKRAVSVQQRLTTIEEQNKKLDELTGRITDYDDQMSRLNSRSDSLRKAIQQSVQSEKRLSGRVQDYRESLEERDQLILSIIDSVLVAYQDLDIESMGDLENARKNARMNAEGNPLKLIQSIATDNVEFLNSNPRLGTKDYLRMNAVQHQFATMWSKTGDKLAEIYGGKDVDATRANIKNAISKWDASVTTSMWTSVNNAFEEAGIQLEEFGDPEAFFTALSNYLDSGISTSKEANSNDAYQRYQKFTEFWNSRVKKQWSPFITEGEVLSNDQMASIDQKLDQWAVNAKPESNLLVYLLGLSLLVVVVLGVLLFREKSHHKP